MKTCFSWEQWQQISLTWSPPQSTYYIINGLLYHWKIHKHHYFNKLLLSPVKENMSKILRQPKRKSNMFLLQSLCYLLHTETFNVRKWSSSALCIFFSWIKYYPPKRTYSGEKAQVSEGRHVSSGHVIWHVTYTALTVLQLLAIWRLEGNLS